MKDKPITIQAAVTKIMAGDDLPIEATFRPISLPEATAQLMRAPSGTLRGALDGMMLIRKL